MDFTWSFAASSTIFFKDSFPNTSKRKSFSKKICGVPQTLGLKSFPCFLAHHLPFHIIVVMVVLGILRHGHLEKFGCDKTILIQVKCIDNVTRFELFSQEFRHIDFVVIPSAICAPHLIPLGQTTSETKRSPNSLASRSAPIVAELPPYLCQWFFRKQCDFSLLLLFFFVLLSPHRCICVLPLGDIPDLYSCAHRRSVHRDIAADCHLDSSAAQAHVQCRKGIHTPRSPWRVHLSGVPTLFEFPWERDPAHFGIGINFSEIAVAFQGKDSRTCRTLLQSEVKRVELLAKRSFLQASHVKIEATTLD